MLTKIDNPRVSYFVRVMALPLVVLVFAAFTFKANTNASIYHGKKITVVIDAGHGGKDLGAKSINGIYEKDFTLAIAKKVKELNDNSDIEIILTRDEDSYSHVKEKADFTKEKNADLFISIHIDNTPVPNTKTGIHFYVARDQYENAEQSKLLASALIGEFTANYPLPVAKSPMQREGGIWTLQASNIPSVLIEAGYLSNNRDLTYLKTNEAKETIAKNVLAAIEKFANSQLQENNFRNNISISDTVPKNIFINTKHSDTNYTKSNDFKNKALVIVDSKEIGNVGINYIDQSNEKFSTAVVYNRVEAQKIYGPKGKYGVIKLTKRDAVFVTADSVFFDEKTRSIKLSGSDINLKGDFSDALIYLENKIITADQLNAIDPGKIDHINILKGDKLNDVTDAKGKKSVIYISLKANDLPGVTIKSKIQTQPLYVLDGVVKDKSFNLDEVNKNDILSIDVLKGYAAIKQYGDKGEDGVIIIKTKNPNRANSFSTVQIADIEAEKTLQQKKLAEQENKVKLDLEARTVKGEKISDDEMAALKLKLASIEQQKKAEVDLVERNVQGRKMTDQELATLKQNLQLEQLSKVKADDLAVRNVQGRKMTDKELATLKQNLQLAQQNKTKVNDLAEITVEGKKLSDQQIQELKQRKLLLEQQAKAEQGNKIFIKMEVSPKFTGGDEAWRKYLQENLNANTPVDEGWKAGKYTVIVKFIVHTDGTVTDVTTENYKGSKTANECIRVIKNAPKWIPAIQNGRNVNAYKKQPITFLIEEAEEEKIKSEASNIYSVPLKVHLMTDDKVNTYNMVGNGTFTVKSGRLYYLNGKIISNPQNIPSSSVIAMESYDEASGQKYFGDKGKYGVLLLKTKS